MQTVLSAVPVVRVQFIRTANNQSVSARGLTATPTVGRLTVPSQHGFIDLDVISSKVADGIGYLDLVPTDDPQVAETFGYDIAGDGWTGFTRRVAVPSTGPLVTVTTAPDGTELRTCWLSELEDFSGASGPTGSEVATRTFVSESIAALQSAADPFPQYLLPSEQASQQVVQGPPGPANVLDVASVSTLAPGSPATVGITGTSPGQHLTFGIPRGADGAAGAKGDKGDRGTDGANGSNGSKGDKGDPGTNAAVLTERATPITIASTGAALTAANNEIVPIDTTGATAVGQVVLTMASGPSGWRWIKGNLPPTIQAPAGYTIGGNASITPGLRPGSTTGEMVTYQLVSGTTELRPSGDFKPTAGLASLFAPRRTLAWDDYSTVVAAAMNGQRSASGHLYEGTGVTPPADDGTGIITYSPVGTASNMYLPWRLSARAVYAAGRFRFDASDDVAAGGCIAFVESMDVAANSASVHCSFGPSSVRLSCWPAGGINAGEVVVTPSGHNEQQPRFPRALPCDGATWITVEVIYDPDTNVAYLIINELIYRYEMPAFVAGLTTSTMAFFQSRASGGTNHVRWDRASLQTDIAAPTPASPRPVWADRLALARASWNRQIGGAGPAINRPHARSRPGATWRESGLGAMLTVAASRSDAACSTTSGTNTVNDAAITAADTGRTVVGPGIPSGALVGAVTAGTSFTLVNSSGAAVNATATANPVALTIGSSSITATAPIPPGTKITLGSGVTREVVTTGACANAVAARQDYNCTIATTTPVINDAAITAADLGRPVVGIGIPTGCYIGTVIAGTSFRLSSSPTSQVDVTPTVANAAGSVWLGATFTAAVPPLALAHPLGDPVTSPGRTTTSDGLYWWDKNEAVAGNMVAHGAATSVESIGGVAPGNVLTQVRAPHADFRTRRVWKYTVATAGTQVIYRGPTFDPCDPGQPYSAGIGQIMATVARGAYCACRFANVAGSTLVDHVGFGTTLPTDRPIFLPGGWGVAPAAAASVGFVLVITGCAVGDVFYFTEPFEALGGPAHLGAVRT